MLGLLLSSLCPSFCFEVGVALFTLIGTLLFVSDVIELVAKVVQLSLSVGSWGPDIVSWPRSSFFKDTWLCSSHPRSVDRLEGILNCLSLGDSATDFRHLVPRDVGFIQLPVHNLAPSFLVVRVVDLGIELFNVDL